MNTLQNTNIVCLGGGRGTSNLIRGLKKYKPKITVITSMADDGGSSGRLRKAYGIMPPGDIISCISALIPEEQQELSELLVYRFPGISQKNKAIDGHKLGNLIMFAEILRTNDFYKAIEVTKKIFGVSGEFLPASDIRTRLSAITKDNRRVHSENTLTLAKYSEPHGIKNIYLTPANPPVNEKVIKSILQADLIISGPGDLYTNQLPVLIIPPIMKAVNDSKAVKIFITNIANKPHETNGYTVSDYIQAVTDHMNGFPFNYVIVNNNYSVPIPKKYRYKYVMNNDIIPGSNITYSLICSDFVNKEFPLYHDSIKLASAIAKLYNRED